MSSSSIPAHRRVTTSSRICWYKVFCPGNWTNGGCEGSVQNMPDGIRPAGPPSGDGDDFRLRSSLYHKAGNVIRGGKILAVFQPPDSKMHQVGRFRVVTEAVSRPGRLRFALSFRANLIFFSSRRSSLRKFWTVRFVVCLGGAHAELAVEARPAKPQRALQRSSPLFLLETLWPLPRRVIHAQNLDLFLSDAIRHNVRNALYHQFVCCAHSARSTNFRMLVESASSNRIRCATSKPPVGCPWRCSPECSPAPLLLVQPNEHARLGIFVFTEYPFLLCSPAIRPSSAALIPSLIRSSCHACSSRNSSIAWFTR